MNIFFLHNLPEKAAQMQADVHIVKMILETFQMLCAALHCCRSPIIWPFDLCKPTHLNHPSTKWVRYSKSHFMWTLKHGISLCEEYYRRYGKIHTYKHKYDKLLQMNIPDFGSVCLSDFDARKLAWIDIPSTLEFIPLAIADDIFDNIATHNDKNELRGISTYKNYYMSKKNTMKRKMYWSKSETLPDIWNEPNETCGDDEHCEHQQKKRKENNSIQKRKRGVDSFYDETCVTKTKRCRTQPLRLEFFDKGMLRVRRQAFGLVC